MDDPKYTRRPEFDPAITHHALDPNVPHHSEVAASPTGRVQVDEWEAVAPGSMEIHVAGPFEALNDTPKRLVRRYAWKTGDVLRIPQIYRRAIQDVRHGVIEGGLAPTSLKLRGDGPVLSVASAFTDPPPPPPPPLPVSSPTAAKAEARSLDRARARRTVQQ